ncbi:MAG: glycine-rich domain-containing protein [Vicinamibacterales bacterium]
MIERRPATPATASVTNPARRALLRALAAGTGAVVAGNVLPKSWTKPVVDSIVLPLHAQASGLPSNQLFTTSGSFTVPAGITSLRVLAVGGGAGGGGGHQGGGGSGLVAYALLAVSPGDNISLTVGAGGTGAAQANDNNQFAGTPGGTTTFGAALVSAPGGTGVTSGNASGNNGGSGGGGACNGGTTGGAGGSGGGNGVSCTVTGGTGQGDYSGLLANFTQSALTAGAGGAGGSMSNAGGGGAGGILVEAAGPTAGAGGGGATSGQGGVGYGAGGGAGGYDFTTDPIRFAGGNGNDGIIYIEW